VRNILELQNHGILRLSSYTGFGELVPHAKRIATMKQRRNWRRRKKRQKESWTKEGTG
jgi:hypothetical protein